MLKFPKFEDGEYWITGISLSRPPNFILPNGEWYYGLLTNRRLIFLNEANCYEIYREDILWLEKRRRKLLSHFRDGGMMCFKGDDKVLRVIKSALQNPEKAKFAFLDS